MQATASEASMQSRPGARAQTHTAVVPLALPLCGAGSARLLHCVDAQRHVYVKGEPSPFYLIVNALLRLGDITFERTVGDRLYLDEGVHKQIMAAL